MKKNEFLKWLKYTSLMCSVMFLVTACDNNGAVNSVKKGTDDVAESEPVISILPHTPETLQEYKNDVAEYNSANNQQR